jgi:hypothetical protein
MLVVALIVCAQFISVHGQTSRPSSPDALVKELYRVHNQKHSPFFQTRNRVLLYKYFEKNLADMIWKDAVKSKGEVGVIDGDPLYDAQDMEIKHFAIAQPRYEPGRAMVDANFENLGQKKTITFIVVKDRAAGGFAISFTAKVARWEVNSKKHGSGIEYSPRERYRTASGSERDRGST